MKLSTPRVTVVRASEPDKQVELQTTNQDLVLWDRTRIKHKWPKFDEAPFLWLTFISWAAARREGVISPETRYETWESDVLECAAVEEDADSDTGAPFSEGQSGTTDSGTGDSDTDGS